MKKYILKSISVLFGSILAVSCTGSFDEVNTDPDNPLTQDTPSTNILAFVERYASENMFDEWFDMWESCGYAGQLSKTFYREESYYAFRSSVNSNSWEICDNAVAALKTIMDKEDPTSNMWNVANIFQCQIWQVKTDRWGNIPYWSPNKDANLYNEALQLENNITAPKYDKQQYIYPDLLKRLASSVAALEAGTAEDEVGNGDVMLGADTYKWIMYANALRLRIAARIANKSPILAQSTFEDVIADGNFPRTNDDNVFFQWNAEYAEPWASFFQERGDESVISDVLVNVLNETSDPRLPIYAEENGDGDYVGYPIGSKSYLYIDYSLIGNRFESEESLKGFTPWLRSCETRFALAYLKNKFTTVNVKIGDETKTVEDLFKEGIQLSMKENEVADAEITTYLSSQTTVDEDNILKQWWISVFKNGMEAWSVYRMAPVTSYLYKNNYIAKSYKSASVVTHDHYCPPMSYGYPDTERNLNTENCAVESAAEDDYFWGKKQWWDTRDNPDSDHSAN